MGLTLEIIFTLQAVVDRTDRHNTLLLAQIFWVGAAMLHTNFHVLYCRILILFLIFFFPNFRRKFTEISLIFDR